MNPKKGTIKTLLDYLFLSLATAVVAVGVYFFKFPNKFSTGGVAGLSIILSDLLPTISPSTINLVINMGFLALGFLILKRSFGFRTFFSSTLLSLYIQLLEWICPLSAPLTDQKMLELMFSVLLPAIGSALIFHLGGSTGGTDIIAMILRKYTSLDIGKASLCTDFLIACSAIFVFGIEIGLYSILGLAIKALMIDSVIGTLDLKKNVTVITTKPQEVEKFIIESIHRGATVWQGKGAFTEEERYVILSAMSRSQAGRLRQYVKSIDPKSFILVTSTTEIFGRGFLSA